MIDKAEWQDESDFEDSIPSEAEVKSWEHHWLQERRAKAVFDELVAGMPDLLLSEDDGEMQKSQLQFDNYIQRLNGLIAKNLDSDSIWEFVFLSGDLRESVQGKARAAKRHTENRAMKADVFKWLDDNFASCKSMDAAAEAMAGKLVPATFRTVRDWVTDWKKLRSASTP
jgi:hypothetical protein